MPDNPDNFIPYWGRRQLPEPLRHVPASVSNVPRGSPSVVHPGRTIATIATVASVWATALDPTPYTFMGGRQPFEAAQLPPAITAVTAQNPPFGHPMRRA